MSQIGNHLTSDLYQAGMTKQKLECNLTMCLNVNITLFFYSILRFIHWGVFSVPAAGFPESAYLWYMLMNNMLFFFC